MDALNNTSVLKYKESIMKYLMLPLLLLFLGGCSMKENLPFDDIRNPRFSPDGKQIVFDIANGSFYERIRIYLYNLETKELSTYKAPDGQSFEMASFSDDGKKLVFITSPIGDRNSSVYKQRNEILLEYQIAIMNVDGTDMQVLTSDKHLKIFPAFSHKGDKIIFAMAEKIRDKGATPASFYNLWELDLKKGKGTMFMGKKFSFYQMGYSTYFNDDERVLLNAYGPMDNLPTELNVRNFHDKTNSSNVYQIKRGQTEFSMPILMEFLSSNEATMDKDENIYFDADEKKEGSKIRKFGIAGQFSKWDFPIKQGGTSKGMSVSKDGKYVAYCFTSSISQLMFLDTNTGVWSEIVLPKTAKEIRIKSKE
jgi:Tol biopolymer transport system component